MQPDLEAAGASALLSPSAEACLSPPFRPQTKRAPDVLILWKAHLCGRRSVSDLAGVCGQVGSAGLCVSHQRPGQRQEGEKAELTLGSMPLSTVS